jgi:alpha-L-arabinofuranosidase
MRGALCLALLALSTSLVQAEDRITVDSSRTGASISKYIYGQFIEHLGRSIYGGLWAEMLQDRKFFFIISDRYAPWGTTEDPYWGSGLYEYLQRSPWKVVGPPGTVTMDTERPFTGIHSPSVQVPGNGTAAGISQEGLALLPGKRYTGRIVLAGDTGISVSVRLVQDDGNARVQVIAALTAQFRTYPLSFEASGKSDNARLEITGARKGVFRVGAVSLMPADNVEGWRADTVALLMQLNSPVYRWPGGNFVSGYNWRDGIGDRDRRPPRQNPAWKGVEPNDVGIHEYMGLMSLIGAEPYVALNTGLGTVADVAAEVQYCNGSVDTPMGKLRAANGHPEPFHVSWWAVGNEMYGEWQLGHMPIDEYVKKHNAAVDAIRGVDPGARVVGVGSLGSWDQAFLRGAASHLDLISEHVYRKEMTDVEAHTRQLAEDIDLVAAAHRAYRSSIPELADRDIPVAMDEWNYWYGRYVYGELGVQYHLKDALGVARALHAFFRNSDIYFMANYAQTVNVIGAIKTTRTAAAFDTTGLVLELYRNHFGSIPLAVAGQPPHLDVSAALTEDRKAITISVVNPTPDPRSLAVDIGPARPAGTGTRWTITGPDPMAANVPGEKPNVVLREEPFDAGSSGLTVPRYSVAMFRFPVQ